MIVEGLRSVGLWEEATLLGDDATWDWGQEAAHEGRVLTALSPCYPATWLRRLGDSAPPALWLRGTIEGGAWLGVAGTRDLQGGDVALVDQLISAVFEDMKKRFRDFPRAAENLGDGDRIHDENGAARVGMGAGMGADTRAEIRAGDRASLGFGVISGGAVGTDRCAAKVARRTGRPLIEVLPFGLGQVDFDGFGAQVSLCGFGEGFSSGAAMERNRLIYAAGHSLVVGPRLGEGGTWWGASSALGRNLGPVGVFARFDRGGVADLVARGAHLLARRDGVRAFLEAEVAPPQLALFGQSEVREHGAAYTA